ncbi:unnamed protein product [Vicia faba]|uniref:Uncharacterized protein n=1 Tax=Vicia faba TaxID=3906 RepID=A0AAV1B9S1_VICFA|nr:unnamed protein product [Vicia faba]
MLNKDGGSDDDKDDNGMAIERIDGEEGLMKEAETVSMMNQEVSVWVCERRKISGGCEFAKGDLEKVILDRLCRLEQGIPLCIVTIFCFLDVRIVYNHLMKVEAWSMMYFEVSELSVVLYKSKSSKPNRPLSHFYFPSFLL